MVDSSHVDRGRRDSDPAEVSRLKVLGQRVGPEQFRLGLRRGTPATVHTQGDDP
ncbi:hypothetical protein [Streptomyces sp. NPDC051109]|uniref:hypothetical protein n=1 Tax=Streptomyces sp. NPDC051109 TaxID=3365642 RepID=UPI001416F288